MKFTQAERDKATEMLKEFRRSNTSKPLMSVRQAKRESIVANEQVIVGLMEEINFRRNVIKILEK